MLLQTVISSTILFYIDAHFLIILYMLLFHTSETMQNKLFWFEYVL